LILTNYAYVNATYFLTSELRTPDKTAAKYKGRIFGSVLLLLNIVVHDALVVCAEENRNTEISG